MVHKCQEKGVTSRQVAIAQDLKPRDLDYGHVRLRETCLSSEPAQVIHVSRDSTSPFFFIREPRWPRARESINSCIYGKSVYPYVLMSQTVWTKGEAS